MKRPDSYLTPQFGKAGQENTHPRLLHADDWKPFSEWATASAARLGNNAEQLVSRTPQQWRDIVRASRYFGSFADNRLSSLGQLFPAMGQDHTWEAVLEVHPSHQRKGIGTLLYRTMCAHVRQHHPEDGFVAHIMQNNPASIRAAEKAGLVLAGALTWDTPPYLIYKAILIP